MSRAQIPASTEPKTRGANRSTKAAGKLKVLPEQPDLPTLRGESPNPKEREESTGTGGDSDDGDVDENEEDVEVRVLILRVTRRYLITFMVI